MRIFPFCIYAHLLASACADTTESISDIVVFDTRDSIGSTEVVSPTFPVDARELGNTASTGSTGFLLDTVGSAPTNLVVVGPSSVVAGTTADYKVIWHAGGSDIDVTAGARWHFITAAPGNTGMVPPTFYAGETSVPVTVRMAASYQSSVTGQSQETAPFEITITPRIQANLSSVRLDNTSGLVNFATGVQGASGSVVVKWDLDGDGQFDDATGDTVTRDYGAWTGTAKVKVEVIDGQGNRRIEERSVILNKPPAANQPLMVKPAYDPGGFDLFLPDGVYDADGAPQAPPSAFVFNADGMDRRDSGLVVIAHGLKSDAKQQWLTRMGRAIESNCAGRAMTPPDIALLDWSEWADDPSELPELQKTILRELMEYGLKKKNWYAAGTAAAGEAINFGFDLYWVKRNGMTTGQMLASWIYQNSRIGNSPQINANKPIHLIGHSAGGFVVGEAARLLKHPQNNAYPPVYVDLVTMLDTPFPAKEHLAQGSQRYPNPGTTERYISSFYGDLDEPLAWFTSPHSWYRRSYVLKSGLLFDFLSPGTGGHGYSYEWFTKETDPLTAGGHDGFAMSPIINPSARISKPLAALRPNPGPNPLPEDGPQPAPAPGNLPDIVPTGWETFGNASESAGMWTLTESADAGIWNDLALPVTAGTLSFEFHFLNAGDGDFLAVHFGDNPALYQGLDLPLSRDAWLPADIPLDLLPSLDGKLVLTLVSRGGVNAQVQLRNIRIIQTDDPDSDGLTVDQETTAGSEPRNPDSDGDGISDGEEVNIHQTDPTLADTDGDGQQDASELAAGTNPLANGSLLRVTSVEHTPSGFVLNWSGIAGKTYRVMRSQELGSGNFETLAFSVSAVEPVTTFTDINPPPLRAFYWIEVE